MSQDTEARVWMN